MPYKVIFIHLGGGKHTFLYILELMSALYYKSFCIFGTWKWHYAMKLDLQYASIFSLGQI